MLLFSFLMMCVNANRNGLRSYEYRAAAYHRAEPSAELAEAHAEAQKLEDQLYEKASANVGSVPPVNRSQSQIRA